MKNQLASLLLVIALILLLGCKQSSARRNTYSGISHDTIVAIAKQAYVYGYPLVLMYETMRSANAPLNQFRHSRSFPNANFKNVVKPNCDTYYSTAWLDLRNEPLVLSVPNTNGRYYLLPMLDAYTNVFASPGKRTTGTASGYFLITSPDYNGPAPSGMKELKSPTNLVWIIGRTQVNSETDGKEVVWKLQDGYKLTPLSKWGTNFFPEKYVIDTTFGRTPPPAKVENMDIETFFNEMNKLLADIPPKVVDSAVINSIAKISIGAGKQFSLADFDTTTQRVLKTLPSIVHQGLRTSASKIGNLENGWNVARSGGGSYGTNYILRAIIALTGLGANLNADACYPTCHLDINGNKLNGSKKYTIHFNKGQTPPVNAFWSLTIYGTDELLVANPINRFAIGDRNNLKLNKDGSLDIYIQNERPVLEKESNWLPAPKEDFSITMRLYHPKEEFLNGTWKIPPVEVTK